MSNGNRLQKRRDGRGHVIDSENKTKGTQKTWHLPIEWLRFFRLGFSSSPFILTERELLLVTAEPELCVGC